MVIIYISSMKMKMASTQELINNNLSHEDYTNQIVIRYSSLFYHSVTNNLNLIHNLQTKSN